MAAFRSVLILVGPKGSGKTYIGSLVERELGVRFLRVEPIFLENMRGSHLTGTALEEDTAVEPAKLPEFIKRFREVISRHGAVAGYYGHCSVGCMHIRPLINLKEESEKQKMVSIADSIADLVLEFNGAMSGEHGDGLARSHFNHKLFGPALYEGFRQIKRAFDPKNIMNPGKIFDA